MSIPLTVELAWRVLGSEEMLEAIQRWARRYSEPRAPRLDDELERGLHAMAWIRLGDHRAEQIEMAVEQLRRVERHAQELWPIYGEPPGGDGAGWRPRAHGSEPGRSLLSAALSALARRFVVDRGMGIALRPDTLDEFQRIAKLVEFNQVESFCWATGAHTSRSWPAGLSSDALRDRTRGPLLATVADPFIEALTEKGLAEVHRHFNGSASPMLLWTHLLGQYRQLTQKHYVRMQSRKQRGPDAVERATMARQLAWLRLSGLLRMMLLERLRGDARDEQWRREWMRAVVWLLSHGADELRTGARTSIPPEDGRGAFPGCSAGMLARRCTSGQIWWASGRYFIACTSGWSTSAV